jgi:hypothetical protein
MDKRKTMKKDIPPIEGFIFDDHRSSLIEKLFLEPSLIENFNKR